MWLPGALLLILAGMERVEGTEDPVQKLQTATSILARQLMLQQLYLEEMTRNDGHSGLKQVRVTTDGTKPYDTATTTGRSAAAMHSHADFVRTVGLGELVAVLNGVQFRTRHNDYTLQMPSMSSTQYHATEPLPYPDVPPAVLNKTTLTEQAAEMREWFKAFRDDSTSPRDYRRHFTPVLCYLEGAWTTDQDLQEPFHSDRHHLEASSWLDLQDKIRYTSALGSKNKLENFAYLPTTLLNFTDNVPVLGQWNYRILCHQIQGQYLKPAHLQPVDNLAKRVSDDQSWQRYQDTKAARFTVNPLGKHTRHKWSRMDEIMYQIPGKDNYQGYISDEGVGTSMVHMETGEPLNLARYNRWYKMAEKDAMGETVMLRGYSDRNLYVASTTQPRVALNTLNTCKAKTCYSFSQRVSYAVPLEVIYLTPLHTWNPHDLEYKGDHKSQAGKSISEGGRSGKLTPEGAFNGINSKNFYMTPKEFFTGEEVEKTKADTSKGSVGVLDKGGVVRAVKASGVRVHLPNIPGVGIMRQRYPVFPVYDEGSPIWKEVEALRDVVMDLSQNLHLLHSPPTLSSSNPSPSPPKPLGSALSKWLFQLGESNPQPYGLHHHTIRPTLGQMRDMRNKRLTLTLDTTEENAHSHKVKVRFNRTTKKFEIVECDGKPACIDGHSPVIQSIRVGS